MLKSDGTTQRCSVYLDTHLKAAADKADNFPEQTGEFATIPEIAKELGRCEDEIYHVCRTGRPELDGRKVGKRDSIRRIPGRGRWQRVDEFSKDDIQRVFDERRAGLDEAGLFTLEEAAQQLGHGYNKNRLRNVVTGHCSNDPLYGMFAGSKRWGRDRWGRTCELVAITQQEIETAQRKLQDKQQHSPPYGFQQIGLFTIEQLAEQLEHRYSIGSLKDIVAGRWSSGPLAYVFQKRLDTGIDRTGTKRPMLAVTQQEIYTARQKLGLDDDAKKRSVGSNANGQAEAKADGDSRNEQPTVSVEQQAANETQPKRRRGRPRTRDERLEFVNQHIDQMQPKAIASEWNRKHGRSISAGTRRRMDAKEVRRIKSEIKSEIQADQAPKKAPEK